jgi:hypothetical protein
MDTQGNFYLGRIVDPQTGKAGEKPLLYEPEDLTTHGVVVGMTGSGKTGLCIGLLEEAALNGIPALMIDPKGDITNALLHFPDLLPQDFQPWVNPDEARRAGQSIEQAAAQAAENWRKGLADWGIEPERLRALRDSAHFAVYTPGSDAGIPVSILASLKAPPLDWESNRELLREKISGTVTALLGLVGLQDIDPVRSREHILLSNIFENAWRQGQDLHLDELILQTQNPPFQKLGVFDVNTFFPEKDRFGLAMLLNNILAAPAFQTWIEGQPLDIPSLLYGPDGRPRHSVFYIAHLNDAERMFFVTLLFSAVEAWMRTQSGTTSLRALLYFDEIFGYMPPTSNPPSKQPMLRMLKQARAFGVGVLLVTQNPVDLDYKGLSNAGTWFIGKLQTDRDKQRLLDGLEGALAGALDRSAYDKLISGLGKRVFLMHNVHNKEPVLFQTRWAMNYLAGPLTRAQIPALNALVGARLMTAPPPSPAAPAPAQPAQTAAPAAKPAPVATPAPAAQPRGLGSATRPAVPGRIAEYFLPNNLTLTEAFKASGEAPPAGVKSLGLLYRPALLAQARARFLNRKYDLDHEETRSVLVTSPDRRGMVKWENHLARPLDPTKLDDQPAPEARFAALEAPFSDAKIMATLEKDFADWAFYAIQIKIRANEALKVYAGPQVTQAEFRTLCSNAARAGREAEAKKVEAAFARKLATLQERLAREERELAQDETEHSQRKLEELGSAAETVFGLFGGRKSSRRLSSSLTKRRLTEQAKADVEESRVAIAELKKQIAAIEQEKAQALEEVNNRWSEIANQVEEIQLTPLKKDVLIDAFGVAWVPYYVVQAGDDTIELPAFQ